MSAEPTTRGFDVGYVLFIDIVGYSKLSGEEQSRVVRPLNEAVRATQEFQRAEAAGQLLRLPAGDGMALVFSSPEAPVQCALEIGRALKEQPHVQVRMGVNSGPIDQVEDVNDRSNVSGTGIGVVPLDPRHRGVRTFRGLNCSTDTLCIADFRREGKASAGRCSYLFWRHLAGDVEK